MTRLACCSVSKRCRYAHCSLKVRVDYWSYENEYRVIARNASPAAMCETRCDELGYVEIVPTALVGIIEGGRMPRRLRAEVAHLVKRASHDIEHYRADINHRDYGLSITRVR